MKRRIVCLLLSALVLLGLVAVTAPEAAAASSLKTSDECIELIKGFEGFSSKAYYDYGQYTIGYGTACDKDEYPNGITEEKAEELLKEALVKFESAVNKFADKYSLNLNQQKFDALVSFTYNLGSNWMNNDSTFRQAVINGSVGNDFIFAIARWCTAGEGEQKAIHTSLVKRRLVEANMYLNGVYSSSVPANYKYVIFSNNLDDAVNDVRIQAFDTNYTDSIRANPTKTGYRFLGWYTKASGGEWVTSVGADTTVSMLYGHWQQGDGDAANGIAAEYVRYAGADQPVYDAPGGQASGTLKANDELTVTADYMDAKGVKWGKTASGWVELSKTSASTGTVEEEYFEPVSVLVMSNDVNVRSGPGTNYSVVGKANKGQSLTITNVKKGGIYEWGQFSGGWICLDYTDYALAKTESSEEANVVTGIGTVINTEKLNIRNRPGTSGTSVVGQYSKGDQFEITLQQKVGSVTWGKTDKGWVSLYYVKLTEVKDGEVPETTAPTEPEATEPAATEPAATEPAATEPAATEPAATEPAATEPAATEPAATEPEATEPETEQPAIATGTVVDCTTLRVRAGAGTKYAKVGTLNAGDKVNIYERVLVGSQVWGRIDGGWICLDYVRLDASDSGYEDAVDAVVVNCTKLNVRSGPGTSYPRIGQLKNGDKIQLVALAEVGNDTWGLTIQGWVSMKYVRISEESGSADATEPAATEPSATEPAATGPSATEPDSGSTSTTQTGVIVKTDSLRVRSAPGTDSKQVGTLKRGEKVEILETFKVGKATWGRIEKGWIHMYYVQLSENGTTSGSAGTTESDSSTEATEPDSGSTGSNGSSITGEAKIGTIVKTTELKVRSAPGTDSKQVGTLKKGDRVVITETFLVGKATWGKTEKGWIHMYYVQLDSETVPQGAVIRTVNVSSLRIRAGAGTEYEELGSYKRGTEVVILQQATVNGQLWGRTDKGWISMNYVE